MKRTRRRRSGFTLMEVITAITVTALVATVAAAALRAGLDVRERVAHHRVTVDAEARATEWIAAMFRHAPAASAVNEPLFTIAQGANGADSVTFLSRGVEQPAGVGRIWRVTMHTDALGLHLHAVPLGGSGTDLPLESILPHISAFRAEALSASTPRGQWLRQWPVLRSAPAGLRLRLVLSNGTERAPLVFSASPLAAGVP